MYTALLTAMLLLYCGANFANEADATVIQTGATYSHCLTVVTEGTRQTTRTEPCVWSSAQLWVYAHDTLRPLSDPYTCLDATANIIAGQATLYVQPCRNSILQKFQFSHNTCHPWANHSLCIAHGADEHADLTVASCEKAIHFFLAPPSLLHKKFRSLENLCLGSRVQDITIGTRVTGAFCEQSLARYWDYNQKDGWMRLHADNLCISLYPGPVQAGQFLRFLPCRHTVLQAFSWSTASPIFVRSDPRLCVAIDGGVGGRAVLVPCHDAQIWFSLS